MENEKLTAVDYILAGAAGAAGAFGAAVGAAVGAAGAVGAAVGAAGAAGAAAGAAVGAAGKRVGLYVATSLIGAGLGAGLISHSISSKIGDNLQRARSVVECPVQSVDIAGANYLRQVTADGTNYWKSVGTNASGEITYEPFNQKWNESNLTARVNAEGRKAQEEYNSIIRKLSSGLTNKR